MIGDRIYVYVDGESHFHRSEVAWRELHGDVACLQQLRVKGDTKDQHQIYNSRARVFWMRSQSAGAVRSHYFTAAFGDEATLHDIRVALRDFGLTPFVSIEPKDRAANRIALLTQQKLIEKAKGVDISLAVQMLEDANLNAFDICHLYTSDADFLPVIQAVQRRGKQVYVFGHKNGLATNSPLLHVPDLFTDVKEILRDQCEQTPRP